MTQREEKMLFIYSVHLDTHASIYAAPGTLYICHNNWVIATYSVFLCIPFVFPLYSLCIPFVFPYIRILCNETGKSNETHSLYLNCSSRMGIYEFDLNMEPRRDCLKVPFPYQIDIMKGYKNAGLVRDFCKFVLGHPVALEFYNWLQDTLVPDEHYIPTLVTINATKIEEVLKDEDCE